jgi:hypothetical protein
MPPGRSVKQITFAGFSARHSGPVIRERVLGFRVGKGDGIKAKEMVMGQLRTWRSGSDQRAWLSLLIDTMEQVSRPETRAVPCDINVLAAFRAQLARPATALAPYPSNFSLRN